MSSASFTGTGLVSANVDIPVMPAITIVAHFLAHSNASRAAEYEDQLKHNRWPTTLLRNMLPILNGEAGLRTVKFQCDYVGHVKAFQMLIMTASPASNQMFGYDEVN